MNIEQIIQIAAATTAFIGLAGLLTLSYKLRIRPWVLLLAGVGGIALVALVNMLIGRITSLAGLAACILLVCIGGALTVIMVSLLSGSRSGRSSRAFSSRLGEARPMLAGKPGNGASGSSSGLAAAQGRELSLLTPSSQPRAAVAQKETLMAEPLPQPAIKEEHETEREAAEHEAEAEYEVEAEHEEEAPKTAAESIGDDIERLARGFREEQERLAVEEQERLIREQEEKQQAEERRVLEEELQRKEVERVAREEEKRRRERERRDRKEEERRMAQEKEREAQAAAGEAQRIRERLQAEREKVALEDMRKLETAKAAEERAALAKENGNAKPVLAKADPDDWQQEEQRLAMELNERRREQQMAAEEEKRWLLEQERLAKELEERRALQERQAREQEERRIEQERLERLEQERLEQERIERAEAERVQQEQLQKRIDEAVQYIETGDKFIGMGMHIEALPWLERAARIDVPEQLKVRSGISIVEALSALGWKAEAIKKMQAMKAMDIDMATKKKLEGFIKKLIV